MNPRHLVGICVVVSALVFGYGCGSSGDSGDQPADPQPGTSTSTGETPAVPVNDSSEKPLDLTAFVTPDGNISCFLGPVARCDIAEKDWDPGPKPKDCDLDWGQGLQVGGQGLGEVVCAGDTAMNPDAPVLESGQQTQVGDFLCANDDGAVSCVQSASNHGFKISRASIQLF